jgi:hypothetical protein
MAGYTDLGGVRTWYDEHGEGPPLVLLHQKPALCRAIIVDSLTADPVRTIAPVRRG